VAAAKTSRGVGSWYIAPRVALDAVSYDTDEWKGALVENLVYDDPDAGRVGDVHYIIHDGTDAYDVRNDASSSEVGVTVAQLQEVYLDTTIPLTDGDAELYQQALINESDNAPSVLVDNKLTLPSSGDHKVTTLANPEFGDGYNESYTVSQGYYDVFVATDGIYYAAFAQRESWRKAFDEHHVGIEGVTSGTDESAWNDAYVEGDVHLDTNDYNEGDLDLAFGLSAEGYSDLIWTTAIGFGTTETDAVDRAVSSLESGFENERKESAW
jgi:hypothetical protein